MNQFRFGSKEGIATLGNLPAGAGTAQFVCTSANKCLPYPSP